jgi:hypothetical protein
MNPTRYLPRALFFPLQAGFMGENDLGGSTPQFSSQMQILHPTRDREGSDGLNLEERSSESTVTNKTERVLITRKFPITNLSDH